VSLGRKDTDNLIASIIESLLVAIAKERRKSGQSFLFRVAQAVIPDLKQREEDTAAYTDNIFARERGWYDRDLEKEIWPAILCGMLQEVS
jgi:hypothetical protein